MATTVRAPSRPPLLDFELRLPAWLERVPQWLRVGAFTLALIAASAAIRTYFIGGQLWMDEAITTGIASHPVAQIPGLLLHDGSPPLYYVLLHFWMAAFGMSEVATHSLSLLFGLATIPIGIWAGWSLFGRRAGLMSGVLFAFNAFLSQYAQETRMYELMGLFGLIATAAFMHAFVYRRRRYLPVFAATEALMLYTHAWAIFYGVGTALVVLFLMWLSDEPKALLRDGIMVYGAAAIAFLPWLPNFIYQATHTGAPWDARPRFGAPIQVSRNLLGGDRVTMALAMPAVIGFAGLGSRARRRTTEAKALWVLLLIPVLTLALAWIASQITPAWVARYFAPVLAPILLAAAWGCSRAGVLGALGVLASVIFLANPATVAPHYKSNMREVGAEMGPLLHRGDLVITGQPEQIALMWYYLPGGLRWASTLGPVADPTYMNWVNAMKRLDAAHPASVLDPMIAKLRVGQQVLFVRPLTQGASNWRAPWTRMVRRRSAQWGAILTQDVARGILKPVAVAPEEYPGACCVADSAVLYRKIAQR
jgi:mannosyltransferase